MIYLYIQTNTVMNEILLLLRGIRELLRPLLVGVVDSFLQFVFVCTTRRPCPTYVAQVLNTAAHTNKAGGISVGALAGRPLFTWRECDIWVMTE